MLSYFIKCRRDNAKQQKVLGLPPRFVEVTKHSKIDGACDQKKWMGCCSQGSNTMTFEHDHYKGGGAKPNRHGYILHTIG